ncbi:MAG: hypothetical protein M1825_002858 [Sarcosagium campestre]|nr:MAG: hypothetical protein M1825_002858 [Sarcosagium campestre]
MYNATYTLVSSSWSEDIEDNVKMPQGPINEHTPLIQVVRVSPRRHRYSHGRLRRFCTALLACSLIVVLILFLLPVSLLPFNSPAGDPSPSLWSYAPWAAPFPHKDWPHGDGMSLDVLEGILLETPREDKAREWSSYYASGPHTAGKNLSQAIWTKVRWTEFGLSDVNIVSYDVFLNYPIGHRLALLERSDEALSTTDKKQWHVKYEASLEEDVLEEDGTSGLEDRIPTFHGYSANGNVTAPYVFVNYGTYKDFDDLIEKGIHLKGKIALAKYGQIFRGLKVKRAQELGMVGVILYSDPGDDGDITEANGKKPYPHGPARNPSSVQRGSASFLSMGPGDPTTPGYPSLPGAPRRDTNGSIPSIPSIPISYRDALPLLKALNGHGPNASSFNKYWQGGGLAYKDVEYNIGPSPDTLAVNLVNEQEYVTTPIWNVIGIINGSIPDEVVILGNHRDAWIAGGAGDPNSGSAALNEVIRSFGVALKGGWKPLRTVVFCSWDGEENNLIGSTEWVEEYLPWLAGSAVAYLNVDVGTVGPHFTAAAAPLLNKVLTAGTRAVQSPNQTERAQSVHDLWDKKIRTMGSGSDFTAFQDFAGIPCIDMGFITGKTDPIYHYHSNYDSFDWMRRFGDPGWRYHVTVTKLWSLIAASLIESPLIPFSAGDYAVALQRYLHDATAVPSSSSPLSSSQSQSQTATAAGPQPPLNANKHQSSAAADSTAAAAEDESLFPSLTRNLEDLRIAAEAFDAHVADLADRLREDVPWWKWWQRVRLFYQARAANAKYKLLERSFLHPPGLDDRPWYKHVVFAPGIWTGYSGKTFPGLVESLERGDWDNAKRWSSIIARLVRNATTLLS